MTPTATLLPDLGQATCVTGCRVCYDSFAKASPEHDSTLLRRIIRTGHLSVIRHSNAAFWLVMSPDEALELRLSDPGRYLEMTRAGAPNRWYLSGNYQAWMDALNFHLVPHGGTILTALQEVAPDIFHTVAEQKPDPGRANAVYLGSDPTRSDFPLDPDDMLRHTRLCFSITTSRAVSCQIHRHTSLSVSQRSQRYVDEGDCECIFPPHIGIDLSEYPFVEGPPYSYGASVQAALDDYQSLRGRGEKKEDARYVLPGAVATTQVVTGTLRAWQHFIAERALSVRAQAEVRYVAQQVLLAAADRYPAVFQTDVQNLHDHPELRTLYETLT